ncbi:response regulator transcription factor [Sphingobium chungbukense]|uniref:Chemotaxis protein CheY n=1 Tax=Sphingobium chungbukense TaxID=56193 RepID=A0A0M3ANF9_9SPHN|nr:response regulator transcription factor [Sphingobium chungbukense]KKW91473.1 chemotaxis protein CheY [Sphingobium chungbukense]
MPGQPTILLVEDDAALGALITDMLEDAHYAVDGPYSSLSDAVAAVAMHFPWAAILDIHLHDGDVALLADDLEQYDIPFLFCSGACGGSVVNAHPQAPVVPRMEMVRALIPTLEKIVH